MRLEPPGADLRRTGPTPGLSRITLPDEVAAAVRVGAGVGAAAVALTSTGSAVVAAVLLGVAAWSRLAGAIALFAVASSSVRFGVDSLDGLAGVQSVLGSAVTVGPATGAASSALAGVAVLVGVLPASDDRVERLTTAAGVGGLAAALVAGPGPGGPIGVRIVVSACAIGIAFVAGRRLGPVRTSVALVGALAALVAASWPS